MQAIQLLMDEHRLIEKVLDGLGAYANRVTGSEAASAGLADFVEFIKLFADGLHHHKEEDILFAHMTAVGFPREGGPIAVMLAEHTQLRALVAQMAEALAQPAPWNLGGRQRVAALAREYAAILRLHIQKEDNILYPMARMHLPEADARQLWSQFEDFESSQAAERRRLEALAHTLIERYQPDSDRPVAEKAQPVCGCGGLPTNREVHK
ncbi:MAG: hemerythrin domain-containing protein [Candidatus Wallbacteria bacterium]|nr:hemerythrin domain-containing protein [Candidatus Wallbacteria bacterium]